jgi:hypothetical protein
MKTKKKKRERVKKRIIQKQLKKLRRVFDVLSF